MALRNVRNSRLFGGLSPDERGEFPRFGSAPIPQRQGGATLFGRGAVQPQRFVGGQPNIPEDSIYSLLVDPNQGQQRPQASIGQQTVGDAISALGAGLLTGNIGQGVNFFNQATQGRLSERQALAQQERQDRLFNFELAKNVRDEQRELQKENRAIAEAEQAQILLEELIASGELTPAQQAAARANPKAFYDAYLQQQFKDPRAKNLSLQTIKRDGKEVSGIFDPDTGQFTETASSPIGGGDDSGKYREVVTIDGQIGVLDKRTNQFTPLGAAESKGLQQELERLDAALANKSITPAEYEAARNRAIYGSGGFSITTNPDGTTTITQGGAGKSSGDTDASRKASGASNVLLNNINNIYGGDSVKALTNPSQKIVGDIPVIGNALTSTEYQVAAKNAASSILSILRDESGGALTPDEQESYINLYVPKFGDDPRTVRETRRLFIDKINSLRLRAGRQPIGYDLSEASQQPQANVTGADNGFVVPQSKRGR